MKRMRMWLAHALALALLACAASPALAQSCAAVLAGPATWTGIVNTYYAGAGTSSAGSMSVGVGAMDGRGSATPIVAGDLLLIIQLQDASFSNSNSAAYGGSGSGQGYTSLGSSGLYEYATATGPVAAGSVPLAAPLVNTYRSAAANAGSGQKSFQVIRVPQASTATLTGTLTAPPWNGATGGLVAIDVAGNLNFGGQTIDVDGRGFRGGGGQASSTDATGAPVNAITDYVTNVGGGTLGTAAIGSVPNGAKGEGIAGTPIIVFTATTPNSNAAGTITNTGGTDGTSGGYPVGSFGRGAPGNGGGGGTDGSAADNQQNTGGAGGGNYGIGGKGGFGWTPGTPPGWDGGGMGGYSVPGGTQRLFFGGGGGAGSTNNATGTPANGAASSGAAGGGLVFVRAGTLSGGGTISARGTGGNSTIINDASGGGGAGGSALVFVNNGGGAVGVTINVQGGNGGSNTGGGAPHGPGGGGSGGFALLSGTATVNVAGGVGGTTATSATSTADYGSTSSSGGFQITSLTAGSIPGAGTSSACFPQLTVTKSTSTPFVAAGGTATWTITVANLAGRSAAASVALTDVLPANPNITFASNTAPVLAGGATRTAVVNPAAAATSPAWGDFMLPGGGSVAVTFVANVAAAVAPGVYQNPASVAYLDPTRTAAQTVTPGGTYTSGGTVAGSNYIAASSTAEDVTVLAAPTITKAFTPGAVTVGGTSLLTVTIANPSTTPLTNGGLVDTYPAGVVNTAAPGGATTCGGSVTAAPGGTGFTLAGATFAAGGSCTVTVNVTTTSAGSFVNTIPAGALTNAQNVTNPAAATATLFTNVTVVKSFAPNAVAPNTDSTLTLVLTNPNSSALTLANPGLTDSFPANLVATGGAVTVAGAGCTGYAPAAIGAGATSITFTAGTVPANASCTITFAVRSAVTGIYANTTSGVTTVQTATTGPASNTSNLGVGVINIAKAFAPATIQSGGTSTVTLTLTNPTGVAQTGGAFTDTLANMTVSGNQNTAGTCTPVTALTNGATALSFAGLNVPAAGCTLTFVVTSSTVGAQTNTTGGVITAALPRGPGSNTATVNVVGKPTIAKAFAPATAAPGASSTLTFTIANASPVPLTGMTFTDAYPAGLVNATPLTVGGSCTGVTTTAAAGGGTFNVTAGTIPATSSCTITVAVTSATAASYNNSSSGVATVESGAAGAASNVATVSFANAPTIAKAFGTSPIAQGGTSVITFTLTNGNTIALNNLNFTDALTSMSVASTPIGGTCVGTTNAPALVVGATSLNLTVPALAAGASCTVTVTIASSVSGTRTNTTSGVTSTQTPAAGAPSNTASLVVLSPASLAKNFVPSAVQVGGTTSIQFTLTNPNAATALTTVVFSDTLVNMALGAAPTVAENCSGVVTPTGVAAASTSFSLSLNTLAAGETCIITISPVTSSIASSATGHANTTSTVTSAETAANPGAAATARLLVYAPPTVAKSFSPTSILSGGTSVITFTVTNPNPMPLTDIRFTDDLPANLVNSAAQTFVGAGRGNCPGTIPLSKVAGTVDPQLFTSINLAANASCTVMMDVTSATVGVYVNTVTAITSNQTPTATTGGTDNLAVGRLVLTKAFGAPTLEVNGTTTLTFTINNPGVGNAQNNIRFNDTFPAGLVAVGGAVTFTGACTNATPTTILANATAYNLTDLDGLDNGETCTISLQVRGTTAGVKTNTVTGANNALITGVTDTATVTVYAPPTIAKAFAPATIPAGGTSTLTLTLTNPNAQALTSAAFTDTLANMYVSGTQAPGGTCAGIAPASLADGATALAFSGVTIPASGSCTVTLVVGSSTPGVQPNATSGVQTAQTPTVGAASGVANLTVAGINLSKAFNPASRPLGVPATLTFTLTSTQAVAWTGLAFTDALPANLVVANPANAVTTCGAGSITATAGSGVVSLAGGTMASGASPCTVSVDVVSSTAATYTNNAANISSPSAGLVFSGAAATVQYFGNAALTKAFAPASIAAGGTTVLTFTLTNPAGAGAVAGLGFTDTLPTNVVVAAVPGASNTCGATFAPVAGSNTITLSGGSRPAGVSTCTATVSVTSSVLGTYVNNSSNVSALSGGLTATTANASFSVVGTVLTKAFAPATIGRNGASTLTFTVTNGAGNPAQSGLAFTDTLPTNLVVATPNGLASTCGGAVTAVAGSVSIALAGGTLAAAQATCTIAVNVTSAIAGTYVNTAGNVSGENATMDASGVNATLTVLDVPGAAKAFGAGFVAAGGTTSLTLTFTNLNNTAVTGLAFTDTFPVAPAAMTLANTTTTNTCGGALTDSGGAALNAGDVGIRLSGGTIPANGSCAVTVNVTVPATGNYTNTIAANTITTTNGGTIPTATSASLTVPAAPAIAKSFAGPSGPGRTVTLTFTLTNPNAGTALTGVAFSDTFPVAPGAMVVAAAPNGTTASCGAPTFAPPAGAASIAFTAGTIAASGTCTVTVDIVANAPGTYNNTSGAITATGPVALTGNTASASLSVSQASLAKSFSPAAVDVNGVSVLTFTLTNGAGNPAQSGINFTDTLPANLLTGLPLNITSTCPSGAGAVTASSGSATITVTGASMAIGQASCTITVDVGSAVAATYNNTNAANLTGVQRIDTTAASATLTVRALPRLTKAFAGATVGIGQTTTLAFTIDNTVTNAVNRAGMSFTDTLPAGLTIATPAPVATGACGAPTFTATVGTQPFTASNISVNAGQVCTITLTLRGTTLGAAVNGSAQMSSVTGLDNGVTSQTLTVVQPAATKTFGAASIADNATTALVFTLTNGAGNPAQAGIALGDTLPTGLALNSATPAVAYSAGCSGPAAGVYNSGTRVLSGLSGIAMTAGTASCTVTVSGLTNQATQLNASCAGNPAAFTNLAANVTTTNAANGATDQCLVVSRVNPNAAKTFGAASIADGAATTLVFTLTNQGSNPAQSGIALGDTLPTGLAINSATPAVAYSAGCSGPAAAAYNSGTRVLSGLTGVAMTAGTASCTVTIAGLTNQATQVNASCAANPAAFTNAAASVTTTAATNTSTDQCLVVNRVNPNAAKTFGAASIADGAATTLVFTLTNSGTNPAQSAIALGDTLPTGLRLNSATPALAYSAGCSGPATGAYNGGTRVLSGLTGLAMSAGTASCTVTVAGLTNQATQTNASCAGNPAAFTNLAASVTTTAAGNTSADQCLVVTRANASVAKTFGAAAINDTATTTLVFTLTNSGTNPAQSAITLGDTLPTGLQLASATPAVAYSAGCSGPATAAYASGTRVLSGLTGIAMTAGTATCTVTVAGLTNQATQTNASCAANPAAFTNAAASVTTTNAINGATDQCIVVNRVNPNVAKTFGAASIADGAATTLVFTLTNTGSNPAQSGVALGDTLPTGLRLNSATPAVTYSAGCSGPATAAYASGTRVLSGLGAIAMTAGTASCTVTVAGLTNQATQVNASCAANPAAFTNTSASVTTTAAANTSTDQCLVVSSVNPAAAKTFGAASFNDGAATTLVFTLTNTGSNPAQSGITLGDTLPTGLAINSATPAVAYSAGCSGPATASYASGTRVLSGLTGLAMGAGTASCTVTVAGLTNQPSQVNASCAANPAAFTNAAASVTTTGATNAAADQCVVVNRANASAAKTFGAASIADGGATTLVFTLTNSGTNPPQSGITLGDTLPTGLAINSATPAVAYSGGCSGPATAAYASGTRVLSGLTGIAMAGGTASCTVTVAGITNQATQANASCAANPAAFTNLAASVATTGIDNGSIDRCLVVTRANPNVAKTFGAASIADGAATTLVFTLANSGTHPAQSGIALGDTLPTGLALNSASPAVAYSAGCSGPSNAAYNAGTRVLSGLTGVAMTAGTASCTVTVAGLTNQATRTNASCAANPAAFTNAAAGVTTTAATNTSTDQCLVVTRANASVAKAFGAASIADNAATTLVFTLTNTGTNPAQAAITIGDTLPTGLALNSATPAVAYSAGCSGPATAAYASGTRVLSGLTGIAMTAGTASCTVTVSGLTNQPAQTNASCAANPAAFTNLAASVTTTNAASGATDQCLVVTQANPSVAKTFGSASIADAATTTLVFTLTNTGSNPAQSGISLGDTLPAGLAINSATPAVVYSAGCSGPAAGAYNGGTRVLSGLTGLAMTAGTASCTVTVAGLTNQATQTNASCVGNPAAFTNAAASVTATGASNASSDQCLVVTRANAAVAKTFGAASIADGAATTLVFTLTNSGSNPAQSGIALGDTLPPGLAINSATPALSYSAGCSGPASAAYASGTRALSGITGVAMSAGTASCTVTVAGLTNQATQTNASCAANPAAFTNTAASVTTTAASNASTDQCLVVTRANPNVAKTFGAVSINDAGSTTLVFTLTNTGTNPAQSGISLGDTLPTGLAINSATPAVAYSAGCSGPATASYASGTRVLSGLTGLAMSAGTANCTVTVGGLTNQAAQVNTSCAANPAAFTNAAASVTATGANNVSTDQCLVVNRPNPNVAKTFGAASIIDGATTTLVFTLANQGSNPAQSGIALGDTLPTGLQLTSAAPAVAYSAGCSGPATAAYNAGTRVISGLTGLAMAGGTVSCTVTVAGLTNQPTQANASCAANPAAFTNLGTNVTTTAANNTSTDQCLVVNDVDPTVAKTFGAASIADGAATTLVFTLTNQGTNPAQSGITLGDTLPTGLALNSATPAVAYSAGCSGPASAAYASGTRVLSGLTGLTMTAGTASCTVTVSGLTNQATQTNASCAANPAAFTNAAASVTATGATPAAADQCLVVTRANPSAAKTFGTSSINDGTLTTLVFTLTNTGTNPAQSGITLGDTLPASLRFNAAAPAVAYSAGCSGPASAAYNSGTRVLSGLTGVAMTAGTASCTVTLAGFTNEAGQVNASCAGNPAAFTNLASAVTTTGATNTSTDRCLVVNIQSPSVAKTFGAAAIADGAATTLVFTLTNTGSNPAQSGIAIGDTLPTGLAINSPTPAVVYSAGCSGPATAAYTAGSRVLSGLSSVSMSMGTASCTVTVSGVTNQATQTNASCAANPAAFTNTAVSVTTTAANNVSTDQCLVVTRANPNVAKTFGAASIADGAATTLVFTLTNSGTNPAQSAITLGDTLPTGLAINSATPAVAYSAGCSGPASAAYASGTRVLSGLNGIAMSATTASCTVTVSGVTNQATQTNASCAANPAAFTNAAAGVTATGATSTATDQCLVVTRANPAVAKTFGAASIADGAATTLVFTLTNSGTNPAQSAITLGDTLPTGLAVNSATPAVVYSAGCSGPANAAYASGTRVLSGLTGVAMSAGTASCTVAIAGVTNQPAQTNASCAANPAAFTNAAANVTATGATNASSDRCLVVNNLNVNVAKTFGAASIADGAATTLVFTIANQGSNPAQSGIAVGDTLPTGLRINSATPAVAYSAGCSGPATAAYNGGTRVLSGLTGIAVTSGTASCTVTVAGLTNQATQTNASCAANPASFTNTAASVTTTAANNVSTDQCLVVTRANPNVAKTFGAAAISDGAATPLVFTLTNSGTNPAQSAITLGDTLPTGLAINSATPAVAYSAGCSGPANAAYASGTRVLSGLTGIAMSGGTASCTVSVAGLTNQASQTNASCAANPAAFTNAAASVAATGAINTSTDQCLVVSAVTPNVAKTFGAASIADGAATTLVFTLTNSGTNPAQSGIALGDTLPPGLAINSATPAVVYSAGCSGPASAAYNSGTRVLSGLGGIAMGGGTASCTVTVAGLTNQATQTNASCAANPAAFTNAAASVSTTGAANVSTDQCLVVTRANPAAAKTFGAASIADGGATTLVFTLTNSGTNPAQSGIALGDTLPSGLRLNSATPAVAYSAGCSGPANAAYASGTRVLSGLTGIAMSATTASCTVTISGLANQASQVNASCAGNPAAFTNLAVNVTTTAAANTSVDQCVVVTAGNASLAKAFTPATIDQGATTTLVFTLANSGTSPAQSGINFVDTLPANVLVAGTPNVQSNCPAGGALAPLPAFVSTTANAITVSGAAIDAGVASCEIRVNVTSATPGTYNNTHAANISGAAGIATTGVNAQLVVQALPALTKAFGAASVGIGQATTLAFTLDNTAANAVNRSGLAFTDALPAGLETANPPVATTSAGCLTPTLTGTANAATTVGASSLGVNAGQTCVVTFTLRGATLGTKTNNAASVTVTGLTNAITPQTVTVVQPSLDKAFGPTSIAVGGTSTLTFTITNGAGNPAQAGIGFTDNLPGNVRVAAAPNVQTSCPAGAAFAAPAFGVTAAAGTALVTVSGATMGAGVASCQVRVDVTAAIGGAYTNDAARITGAANITNSVTPSTLTVAGAAPTLAKSFAPGTITTGGVASLTLTLDNANASAANLTAALVDTLPAGVVVAAAPNASTTCAGAGGVGAAAGGTTVTLPATRSIPAAAGLTPGSCTVTVDVTATLGGAYTNTIAANALQTSNGNNAAPATASLTVSAVAPSVAKGFAPATVAANGVSTLTVTLTNPNLTAANLTAALTDTLPAGVVLATPLAVATSCAGSGAVGAAPGGATITLPVTRSLPAGSGATAGSCTITADVTSAVGGVYTNTIAANALQTSNGNNASPASANLTVNTVAPSLTKSFAPATVNANQVSTLTLTLSNPNASAASLMAALVDALPSPLAVAPTPNASTTCAGAGTVSAAAGASSVTLPATRAIPAAAGAAPGSCTVTVDVVSAVGGTFANTIAAGALQTSNGNNTAPANASLTVNAAAPTIAKAFAPATIAADGTSTITFTLSSLNATALTGASFTDTLTAMSLAGAQSAGGTCAGAASNSFASGQTGLVTLAGLTIPAATGATAGSCTVTIVVTSDVPGAHANQASGVASAQAPTGAASNVATLTVTAAAPTIAKAFAPASIAYGATSTITFTLANTNGVALTAAGFTDALAGMSISGAQSAAGTCVGAGTNNFVNAQTALTFAGLTIPANGSCTVTVGVTSLSAGVHPNQASGVSSAEAPAGPASNTANLTVTATPPTFSKAFAPNAIDSGGVSTLTVTVTNPNGAAVTGIALTDTFPVTPGTGLVRAATPAASTNCPSGSVTSTAGSVTLSGATLAAGASCTFQIDVTAPTAGSYVNTIAAGALASSAGTNAAAASATLTVNPLANLGITKLGPASIATGGTINYSITVTNAGPDAANGASFSDAVPAGVTSVSAICAGASGGAACGTMNVAGNNVTSTLPALPAGGSVSITVSGTASGVGSATNTATVTPPAGVPDPAPANNSASVTTAILAPDLTLTKTHGGNFTIGVNGVYTLIVSNSAGSLTTTGNITVTDSLPAGLGFVSATGSGWACAFAAPTVTCTTSNAITAGTSSNPITLTVSVAPNAAPSVLNFATVSGGGEPAGVTGNNTASDNALVGSSAVNVFQPDGTQTATPGTVLFYPHTFTAGSAGTLAFSTSAIATPAVPGWTQLVYRDTDCNGVLSAAEGAAPMAGSIAVNAGDSVCIVVKDSIPATAPYNARTVISVNATFNGTQTITRTDTTTVGAASGAGLVLAKSVRNVTLGSGPGTSNTARPNDVLEYTITYTNTSAGVLSSIVVTDATPGFTTFESAGCGAPLPGNITSCSVTAAPSAGAAGSVVWTLGGTLLSGGSGTVAYQVRVSP